MLETDCILYYKDRADEYEKIYLKPERQDDLRSATTILQKTFQNKDVLEIGCGTGYWTEKIALTAKSIFATDINQTAVNLAQQKQYGLANVTFGLADFNNHQPSKNYEGLFGGFIWSHINLQDLHRFLLNINRFLLPGARVVFMDNRFVEGSNLPVTKTDGCGNTYQTRILENGSKFLILKNFPSETFIREQLKHFTADIKLIALKYYWILMYTV